MYLLGKIRDTEKLDRIVSTGGNPNDCYSTYARLLHDKRDATFWSWTGHYWGGLGPDQLTQVPDPKEWIEGISITEEEVQKLKELKVIED